MHILRFITRFDNNYTNKARLHNEINYLTEINKPESKGMYSAPFCAYHIIRIIASISLHVLHLHAVNTEAGVHENRERTLGFRRSVTSI